MSDNDLFDGFFSDSPRELEVAGGTNLPAVPPTPLTPDPVEPTFSERLSRHPSPPVSSRSTDATASDDPRKPEGSPAVKLSASSGTSSRLRLADADAGADAPTLAVTERTATHTPATALTRATYAMTGLAVLLVPTVAGYIRFWLPELRGIPGLDAALEQLAPAMGRELARFGAVTDWQNSHSSWLASIALLCALVTFGVLTHHNPAIRRFALFAAAPAALFSLLAALAGLVTGALSSGLIGMLLLVLSVALQGLLTYRCLEAEPDSGNVKFPVRPPDLFVAATVTLLPAFALGRAMGGRDVWEVASRLSDDGFEYLWSLMAWSTLSQLVLGIGTLGVAVLVTRLIWPGESQPKKVPSVVAAVIAIGILFAFIAPWTERQSQDAAVSLSSVARESPVSEQCARWSDNSTKTSIAIAGPECREVRTYAGHVRTSTRALGFSATTPSGEWLTTTGHWVDQGTVTGAYDDVLVVAGARVPYFHSPTVMTGIDFNTGEEKWTYRCGEWSPFLLTLSGSAGGDDPDEARVTVPEAGKSLIVDCVGTIRFLDPITGKPR